MKKTINVIIPVWLLLILFSCSQTLERPLENDKVELIAPANNVTTTFRSNTYVWEELEGATKYRLQIASPRFDSIVRFITDTTVSKTNLTLTLDSGRYEWRVKALNNSSSSKYSSSRTIIIL
jgi:threonine aldolase